MHADRNQSLIEKASAAVKALKINEALFFPGEIVIARSSTGKLRVGTHWGVWYRADADAYLREYLEARLTSRYVYDANQLARNLNLALDNPKPVPVANVGRSTFHPVAA